MRITLMKFVCTMLCLIGLLVAPASLRAQIGFGAEIDDYDPSIIETSAENEVTISVRNTQVTASFRIEISGAPSGWDTTVLDNDWVRVSGGKTHDFRVRLDTNENQGKFNIEVKVYARDDPFQYLLLTQNLQFQVVSPPGPFTITSPFQNQTIEGEFFITWTKSEYADVYDVTIARYLNGQPQYPAIIQYNDYQFVNILLDTATLEKGVRYEIRVKARNEVGDLFNEDGPRSFVVKPSDPLGEFTITQPVPDQQLAPSPTVSWSPSANAARYTVYFFNESGGSPVQPPFLEVPDLFGTSYTWQGTPLETGRYYFVAVVAYGEAGERPSNSGIVRFFISGLNKPFNLALPAADGVSVALRPEFRWQIAEGATEYEIRIYEFYEDKAPYIFHTGIVPQSDGFVRYFLPNNKPLFRGRSYSWHVFARRGAETLENTGGLRFFNTLRMIPFDLVSPVYNDKNVDPVPTFTWEPTPTALNYVVEYTPANDLGKPELSLRRFSPPVTGTSWTSTHLPLEKGRTYFWRVTASDGITSIYNYGDFQPFTISPLEAFNLVSPADGAVDVQTQPILTWQSVPGATGYRVYVVLPDLYMIPVMDVPGNQHSIDLVDFDVYLNSLQTYTWTVEALADGTSLFADSPRTFTTRERLQIGPCDLIDHLIARQYFTSIDKTLVGAFPTRPIDAAFYMSVAEFEGPCIREQP